MMPARLKIRLTEQEKEKLITLRNQGNIPRRSQQRIEILIRSDEGWTVQKIAVEFNCSEKMVRRTIERWIAQEEEGLFDAQRKGRNRRWNSEDIEYLEDCIESEPRTYNSRQLSEKLLQERKVSLSAERIRKILKKKGGVGKERKPV